LNKLLKNEQEFTRANQRMTAAAVRLAPNEVPKDLALELYCECANQACLERVSIELAEYQKHKHDNMFVVLPEHMLMEFERTALKTPGYWAIIKRPEKLDKPFVV
jgi:hypothetical protein